MTAYRPGDRVLYRDGDRFLVAKVDLVKDRHLTGFPFDPLRRRWSASRRRIACDFVVGKLPPQEHADRIAAKLEQLRNQREGMRQQANRWLEENVRELARTPSSSAAVGRGETLSQ
ncbi:hypothetical protein [Porphyrobacter sp. YT40]|uniref:hypothetical protein n=1 Tax=Porphyrobacter sp. YT40 TaxID=2547601 RepID=UPI0011436225|nr:hypothetical protein [Porphyrobacter sp. YT40]QDH34002.1 hypothetical protein E2E27_06425 [Porphyrobacter sp. YT40]